MGSAICCAGSGLCCAGQVVCKSACCLCESCGITPKNFPRVTYVLFDFFWVGISIVLMFTLQPLFAKFPDLLHCNSASGGGASCFGTSAVLRMSFTLFSLHALVLVTIAPRIACSSAFHDGCWFFKFLFVIGVYIGVFWIPNNFYWGWAWLCRVVSGLYLVLQILLLVVVAYTVNDKLVTAVENGNQAAAGFLVGMTVLINCGTLAFLAMQYFWFHACAGFVVVVTYTLVFCLAFFLVVLFRTRQDASVFTSSIVSAYITFLSWSALASSPDSACNPFATNSANLATQIVLGGFFTFVSLFGVSVMSTRSNAPAKTDTKAIGENAKSVIAEDEDESRPQNLVGGRSAEELAVYPVTSQTLVFQGVMLVATLYYPMLVTNWGDPRINNDQNNFYDANTGSFWVKLVSQWVCIGLYTFSLLAPLCCRDREFY